MPYRPRKRNYKRRAPKRAARLAPTTARAVKKIVKNQMAKTTESKIMDLYNEPIPLSCFYHNVPSVIDYDMCVSAQGTFDEEIALTRNRVGDSVYIKNIQMALLISNFSTRPNLMYRITIVKTKFGLATIPGGAAIYGHPQCGNLIMAPIDTELEGLAGVVYDRVFTSANQPSNDGNEDRKFYWKHNLKVNRKIKYDNSAGNTGSASYRLFVTCYDTQASIILDNVARYTYFRRTHFTDS